MILKHELNNKFDLSGRVALVTGGGGLLGLEHAKALINSGASVVITDLNSTILEHAKKELENYYSVTNITPSINYYVMDVTSLDSIINVKEKLLQKGIDINILINNAAINPKVDKNYQKNSNEYSRLENFSLNEWNMQIAVGLTGAFLCSKIFGKLMAQNNKGGVIINISSDLSIISPDQRLYKKENLSEDLQPVKPVTYSVIKHGLIGLTKYLSTYWIRHGVRCNALSPGGIYVDQDENFLSKIKLLIPMERMAKVDEYHSAIQFLCSDASSYMNGHNLIIDGGRTIW